MSVGREQHRWACPIAAVPALAPHLPLHLMVIARYHGRLCFLQLLATAELLLHPRRVAGRVLSHGATGYQHDCLSHLPP